MDIPLRRIVWQQFGAAIDDLGNSIAACPDELWRARLWDHPGERPEFSEFWYIAYHALFWVDLYLTGAEEGFAPRPPFALIEQDEDGPIPERPYTKDELLAYLRDCRKKCQATIEAMADKEAERRCRFGWGEISFAELLLYTMRHVAGHAAQLNLLLGQHSVPVRSWVLWAEEQT
jgi:hypothetical protein